MVNPAPQLHEVIRYGSPPFPTHDEGFSLDLQGLGTTIECPKRGTSRAPIFAPAKDMFYDSFCLYLRAHYTGSVKRSTMEVPFPNQIDSEYKGNYNNLLKPHDSHVREAAWEIDPHDLQY